MTTSTRSRRALPFVLAAAVAVAALLVWQRAGGPASPPPAAAPASDAPVRGGSLVGTLRTEPATFNRLVGTAFPTLVVDLLTQARLVRVNRLTGALEPRLVERWEDGPGERQFTLHLRRGVRWSDGTPFTSDDVAFSFEAVYDEVTASPLGGALRVSGRPLALDVVDETTVRVTFPAPYGPGLRILDGLPVYPRHLLGHALAEGTLRAAWGPATPPQTMAGLGPFVLRGYEPGQRLRFERNPHYWATDEDGGRLPYLDALTLELVPDQSAELLRLQAGQVDLIQNELRPEDYLPLRREVDAGRLQLLDVGVSVDTPVLWFNLGPSPADPARPWLRRDEFRLAVSHAVNRESFVDTVYLGAAAPQFGPVGPGNRDWHVPDLSVHAHDVSRARGLLASIGLTDRDGDGTLEDAAGTPARFTLLVQQGITSSEKGAQFVRDELAPLGVAVDVVALDLGAMMGRWGKGEYDAIYHFLIATDTDPAGNLDWWLSSGAGHVWHPGQTSPATEWERTIDELMRRQMVAEPEERHRLFAEVQQTFLAHSPALYFAAPRVFVATSPKVRAPGAAIQRPQLLWDAERLSVRQP